MAANKNTILSCCTLFIGGKALWSMMLYYTSSKWRLLSQFEMFQLFDKSNSPFTIAIMAVINHSLLLGSDWSILTYHINLIIIVHNASSVWNIRPSKSRFTGQCRKLIELSTLFTPNAAASALPWLHKYSNVFINWVMINNDKQHLIYTYMIGGTWIHRSIILATRFFVEQTTETSLFCKWFANW